jgi:putative transposase
MEPTSHRKTIQHYHDPGHAHELTFSCYGRRPLLDNESWRKLLAESISRALTGHRYQLSAFVFMPEHVHLLVYPLNTASGIDELLKAIKRPFSYRVKQQLIAANSPLLAELTVRQRPGVTTFRFWQEGPGYDRNLTRPRTALLAIDYLHNNPVRRGLCARSTDWKWSSARWYADVSYVDEDWPTLQPLPAEWLDEPS